MFAIRFTKKKYVLAILGLDFGCAIRENIKKLLYRLKVFFFQDPFLCLTPDMNQSCALMNFLEKTPRVMLVACVRIIVDEKAKDNEGETVQVLRVSNAGFLSRISSVVPLRTPLSWGHLCVASSRLWDLLCPLI